MPNKPWDDIIKKLINTNPAAFVKWLVPNATFVRQLPLVLEHEDVYVDGLFELTVNGKTMLLHIEVQTYNDDEMDKRMLYYHVITWRKYNLPVLSCVIYLLFDGTICPSPMNLDVPTGEPSIHFFFRNIEMSRLSFDDVVQIKEVGILPLLPLTKGGATRTGINRMFQEIQRGQELDEIEKAALELIGYTLAALVFRRQSAADQQWLIRRFREMHDRLQESPIYQEILNEGLEKGLREGRESGIAVGLAQGRLEATRDMLLSFVDARFPKLNPLAEEQAKLISDVTVLRQLASEIVAAQTQAEAQQILLTWKKFDA
jgi:predicted transposase YdaD